MKSHLSKIDPSYDPLRAFSEMENDFGGNSTVDLNKLRLLTFEWTLLRITHG